MRELTARQRQLLEFIEDYIGTYGFPPSIREMADQMGIRSTNGVNDHLKALQKKGYISRHEGLKSRAISLLKPSEPASSGHDQPPAVEVPILGRVAAGVPVLSEENFEGTLPLGSDLLPASGRVFAWMGVQCSKPMSSRPCSRAGDSPRDENVGCVRCCST